MADLVDSFGRVHRDLRLSVTDRCDLRCTYCMPAEGLAWRPREELLGFDEIERVVRLLVDHHGIESVRITGGEPLLRRRLVELVAVLAELGVDLSITTNGTRLASQAADLRAAGLGRVNVSLDSLRPERFAAITRRPAGPAVLEGIAAAARAGFTTIKVNAVIVRGVNDDELVELATFGREQGVVVRFIEMMPLDADRRWTADQVVGRDEILDRIGSVYPLEPTGGRGSAPAERFRYLDGGGELGIISSVSHAFCDSCDRIRLTADGQLRTCLFALDDHDLRGPMRAGATDADLSRLVEAAIATKWAGHGIGQVHFIRPSRSMSEIGG